MTGHRACCVQALGQAPAHLLQDRSRDWVPLMLAFSAAKSSDGTAGITNTAGTPLPTKAQPRGMLTSAPRQLAASGCTDPSEIVLSDNLSDGESDRKADDAPVTADVDGSQGEAAGGAVAVLASHVGGRAWRSHIKVSSWFLALALARS